MEAYIDGVDVSELSSYTYASNPFMYKDTVNSLIAGKMLLKIGVPVKTIADPTQDNTMTVYVTSGELGSLTIVETLELTIKANTYNSTTVNEWVYFDVNCQLPDDAKLVFTATDDSDTIVPGYSSTVSSVITGFYTKCLSSSYSESTGTLLYDFIVAE